MAQTLLQDIQGEEIFSVSQPNEVLGARLSFEG